jgi:hypothetical protein
MIGNLNEKGHMRVLGLDKNLLLDGLFKDTVCVTDCTVWRGGTVSWHRVAVDFDRTIGSLMWRKVSSLLEILRKTTGNLREASPFPRI